MENIRINNFRKIKDEWALDLAPITFFVGSNNSGKSSVLKALLLLEDYIKSNNHFELNFQGENARKHKIDCFENAANWLNQEEKGKEGKTDICFNYTNVHEFFDNIPLDISIKFMRDDIGATNNGMLKEFMITNTKNQECFHLAHAGAYKYQLSIDGAFVPRVGDESTTNELKRLKQTLKQDKEKLQAFEQKKRVWKSNSPEYINLNEEERKLKENIKTNQNLINELGKGIKLSPSFELDELSGGSRSLRSVLRQVLGKYFEETSNKGERNPFRKNEATVIPVVIGDIITRFINFEIEHISPQRNNQTRLYINANRSTDINRLINIHARQPIDIESYHKKRQNKNLPYEFIKKWMKEFDIGTDYRIENAKGLASTIEVKEGRKWRNLVDKGFGAGQLFAILLQIGLKASMYPNIKKDQEKHFILIEEPEANLHPAFQSKLAKMFLAVYHEFGIRFILETHSEYMIRKSQVLGLESGYFAEGAENPFGLFYFKKDGEPYEMEYGEEGEFSIGFDTGFFDVAYGLNMERVKFIRQQDK